MNRFFLFLLAAAWLGLGAPGAYGAQAPVPASSATPHRFILVFDTSLEMAAYKETLRNTAFDLVFDGIGGQMRPGDHFILWTFDERTYAQQSTPIVWDPVVHEYLASQAFRFVQEQSYLRPRQMSRVMTNILNAIRAAQDVVVLLVHDGSQPTAGTPFDAQINQYYERNGAANRLARKPFVTMLIAVNGRIAAARVMSVGEPYTLPVVPPPLRIEAPTAPPISAAAPTNAPVRTNRVTAAAPAPEAVPVPVRTELNKPEPPIPPATTNAAPSVIAVTVTNPPPVRPPAAREKPAEPATTTPVPVVAPPPTVTPTPISPNPALTQPAPPSVDLPRTALERPVTAPASAPPVASTQTSAPVVVPSPSTPAPIPSAAKSNTHPADAAAAVSPAAKSPMPHVAPKDQVALIQPPQPGERSWHLLALGTGLVVIAGGLLYLTLRKGRKPEAPSLISRSLDGDGQNRRRK